MARGGLAMVAIAFALAMVLLGHLPAEARSVGPPAPWSLPAHYREAAINQRNGAAASRAVRITDKTAAPIDDYVARRHRQYMAGFVAAGAGLAVLIAAALWYRRRGAVGVGFAALGALGMGAMLQFSSATGMPALLWPPPRLWLGTFAGDFMLAVMCAAVAGVLLRPGVRRLLGSIVIAEAIWWTLPGIAAAAGLTLSIAEPRMRMDWLVFVGTAVGGVAAPAAAWSIAALAAALADRMVPRRTL